MATQIQNIAYLANYAFPYTPNSVNWSYTLNKASFDTVGGRVTQLLSIKIGTMTWEGDAGSKSALLDLFNNFTKIQQDQINNEESSNLSFYAPIGSGAPDKNILVWVRNMEVSWDYQSVTYPYRMQFEVDEEFGQISNVLTSTALDRLASEIGWTDGQSGAYYYSGLNNSNPEIIPGLGSTLVDTNISDAINNLTNQ